MHMGKLWHFWYIYYKVFFSTHKWSQFYSEGGNLHFNHCYTDFRHAPETICRARAHIVLIWLSCIIATYFVRHAVHLFLATHILAKYFVRHIFWDIFLVIDFVRHQHIGEDPFLNSEQQESKHTAPLLFCRPIAESSVAVQCISKKSALRAHTVAIEAQKHKTRFKQ